MSTTNFGSFLIGAFVGAFATAAWTAYQEERRQAILDRFQNGPEIHHEEEEKHEKGNSESIDDIEKSFATTSEAISRVMKDVMDALNAGDLEKAKKNLERCKGTMHSISEDFSGTINGQIRKRQQAQTNDNKAANSEYGPGPIIGKYKISEDPNAAIGL